MMALVREVIFSRAEAGSMLKVARSMSQNTGVAPVYSTALAEAM